MRWNTFLLGGHDVGDGGAVASREQRVAAAFVELAGGGAGVEPGPVVRRLAERCVDLLGVSAAAVVVRDGPEQPSAVAATDRGQWLLPLLQSRQEPGPAQECEHRSALVHSPSPADTAARWPRFATRATLAGAQAVYGVPLRADGEPSGAVVLLLERPGALSTPQLHLAGALADAAAARLVGLRALRHNELLVEQLQTALHSRILVEQAKGVLAERWGVSVDEAFGALRGYARSHNQRVAEVSRAIVTGGLTTDHMRPGRHRSRSPGTR